MKSFISIFLVLATVALCFFGCSNIPEEPVTTAVEKHSYVNPYGETAPAAENVSEFEGQDVPVKYIETVNNVEIVLNSYYVYGNSVAKIGDIEIVDYGISHNANGYADVEIMGIGSRKDGMKIGYTAYTAEGDIVKDVFILAPLEDVKEGDIVEDRRFEVPRDAVKIVFHDYVEK